MPTIKIEGPAGPEEVHLLREDERKPFDEDRFEILHEVRELRSHATPAINANWIGYAMAVGFTLFAGAMIDRWKIDSDWKMLLLLGLAVIGGGFGAAASRRQPGEVPDHMIEKWLALRRASRKAIQQNNAELAARILRNEAQSRVEITKKILI